MPYRVSIGKKARHMKKRTTGTFIATMSFAFFAFQSAFGLPSTSVTEISEKNPSFSVISNSKDLKPMAIIGSVEDITLAKPNTLREFLLDLETTSIGSLTLHGKMGSDDIAVLHENARFGNLQVLDLGDVTLVADEGRYITFKEGMDVSRTTYTYYLSEREEIKFSQTSTGLGRIRDVHNYTMDLGGAFYKMPIKQLVLPRTMQRIGDHLCSGCDSLVEVVSGGLVGDVEDCAFYKCMNLRSIDVRPTYVGEYAFSSTVALSGIDLSKADSIGASAFQYSAITRADLSSLRKVSRHSFYYCKNLKNVAFGNNLRTIGYCAFSESGVTSLVLPEGLTKIEDEAFAYSDVVSVEVPSTLAHLTRNVFAYTPWMSSQKPVDGVIYLGNIALCGVEAARPDDIHFREGTAVIADEFASSYGNVTSVEFPNTLKVIGEKAFSGCNMTFNLPENVEYIGAEAFLGNSKTTSVTLPSSLKYAGDRAFEQNSSLMRLNYNAINAKCGNSLFNGCRSLEKVVFAAGIREIPAFCFSGCSGLVRVEFEEKSNVGTRASRENTLLEFRDYCFSACTSLSKFDFPVRTDTIGEYAFANCPLTVVDLTKGGRHIAGRAFDGNYNSTIQTILMGPSLASVDNYAFTGCNDVKSIYVYSSTPPAIIGNYYDFPRLASVATVYALPDILDAYKADAVWSKFNIVEMDEEHKSLVSGISNVRVEEAGNDAAYDLQGRRVKKTSRGIYIVNGRKVLK